MFRRTYRIKEIEDWRNACNHIPEHIRDIQNKNKDLYEQIASLEHKKSSFEEGKYNEAMHEITAVKASIELLELPDVIASLEQQQTSLLKEINKHQESIKELNNSIANTEDSMCAGIEEDKLRALNHQKDGYIGQQSILYNKVRDLNSEVLSVQLRLQKSNQLQKSNPQKLSEQKRIQQLELSHQNLDALEKKGKHYQSELDSYTATIESVHNQIQSNIRAIASLQLKEREAFEQPFLYPYVAKPDVLISDLIANVNDVINGYEANCPADQTNEARIVLHELSRLSAIIMQESRETTEDKQKTLNRLIGLVWHCAEIIREDDSDLYDRLCENVLTKNCLDKNDAIEYYSLFFISIQLKFMNVNALREYEDSQYNSAVARMTDQIHAMPEGADYATRLFYQSGKNLLRTIARQRNREGRSFDTKFHTTVLEHAAEYLREPGNINNSVQMVKLTEQTSHGKPSFARKLVGAMLMLVGAATSLVGIGLGASSLGMASPIALPLICAGAAVFAFGAGLYGYGCRRGINKRMGTYHENGGKAAIEQGLFAHNEVDMTRDLSLNEADNSMRLTIL